jgi:transporter family protein
MKQHQLFAIISMVFEGLTSVIEKAGLKDVTVNIGLELRISFVFF